MSQDPLDDQIPDFSADIDFSEEKSGFLSKLKGMFKKPGSDDAFGHASVDLDDPFALQKHEDEIFAKRRKVMGFVFIFGFIAIAGAITAAVMFGGGNGHEDETMTEKGQIAQIDGQKDHAVPLHKNETEQETAKDHTSGSTSVTHAMPVPSGPEDLQKALIRPPGADNPDVARRMRSLQALTPEQLAAQQAATNNAPALQEAHTQSSTQKDDHQATPSSKDQQPTDSHTETPQKAETSASTSIAGPQPVIPALPAPRTDFTKRAQAPQLANLPKLPEVPEDKQPHMQKAPQPDLQQRNAAGKTLPTVSPEGRKPWKAYALAFKPKKDFRQISVVLQNLGLVKSLTTAAVLRMPPEITLAFSPYSSQLGRQLSEARKHGHETLLTLGLESNAFPDEDPGPNGLFSGLSIDENAKRLENILSRGSVYLGVAAKGGDRFTASETHFAALLKSLKKMGLLYVAPNRKTASFEASAEKPARTIADIYVPQDTFQSQVDAYLRAAEDIARASGHATIVLEASPLSLSALSNWIPKLANRSFELAPISSVVKE